MMTERTDHKEQLRKNLFLLGITAGFLGGGLLLCGCSWAGWWLIVLAQGRSAAELPEPIAMLYPILMIAGGIVMLSVMGVLLVVNRRLRRA